MIMDTDKVENFLKELELCGSAELPSVVNTARKDDCLISNIIKCFELCESPEISDDLYLCLFELYRTGEHVARQFVLQFVPILIWNYLHAVSSHDKRDCGKMEAILLAIYNAEILDEKGNLKEKTFRVPSLSRPSIYHEPSQGKLTSSVLTESALSRHEQLEVPIIIPGPGQQLNKIVAVNRLGVLSVIMAQYNSNVVLMSKPSHGNLCLVADRIARSGFKQLCSMSNSHHHTVHNVCETLKPEELKRLADHPRIALSADFIIQLVQGLYYCMYNGFSLEATQAIEYLHYRASHSMLTQAYLQTNAIRHLLSSTGGTPVEGPLGLSVIASHSSGEKDSNKYQEIKTTFRQLEKKKSGSALKTRSESLDETYLRLSSSSPSTSSSFFNWRRSYSQDSSAKSSSNRKRQSYSVDSFKNVQRDDVDNRPQSLLLQITVSEDPDDKESDSADDISLTYIETQV